MTVPSLIHGSVCRPGNRYPQQILPHHWSSITKIDNISDSWRGNLPVVGSLTMVVLIATLWRKTSTSWMVVRQFLQSQVVDSHKFQITVWRWLITFIHSWSLSTTIHHSTHYQTLWTIIMQISGDKSFSNTINWPPYQDIIANIMTISWTTWLKSQPISS